MGRFKTAGFIILAVLGFSANVHAVPALTWLDSWNVTLLPNCSIAGSCGGNPRAFGTSALFDGQILDTTSDIAVAKSAWASGAGSFSSGSTGLTFLRHFALSGSPQGWNVSLNGLLVGSIGAGGQFASAFVTAGAAISPGPTSLQWREERFNSLPGFTSVNQAKGQTSILSDGLYTITGSLSTAAGFSGCPCIAFSDFFGAFPPGPSPFGFEIRVSASAVPEPSSLLLLTTGLTAAAWVYRKRSA